MIQSIYDWLLLKLLVGIDASSKTTPLTSHKEIKSIVEMSKLVGQDLSGSIPPHKALN